MEEEYNRFLKAQKDKRLNFDKECRMNRQELENTMLEQYAQLNKKFDREYKRFRDLFKDILSELQDDFINQAKDLKAKNKLLLQDFDEEIKSSKAKLNQILDSQRLEYESKIKQNKKRKRHDDDDDDMVTSKKSKKRSKKDSSDEDSFDGDKFLDEHPECKQLKNETSSQKRARLSRIKTLYLERYNTSDEVSVSQENLDDPEDDDDELLTKVAIDEERRYNRRRMHFQ